MLNASSQFNEEMKSQIRKRLEPVIKVKGIGSNGELIELNWSSNNIKSLTFKRNIDPTGNSLPSMELQWVEVFEGKLNEYSQPFKYENISAQMAVDLEWIHVSSTQRLWEEVSDLSWEEVLTQEKTWFNVLNKRERIKFPRLFLTSQPKVKNNTIVWTAVDLLSFFNQKWLKFFDATLGLTTIKNIVLYGLVEARASFWHNQDIKALIQTSISNVQTSQWDSEIGLPVLCDGVLKEQISLACALDDAFLDFENDGSIKISRLTKRDKVFDFKANIMPSFPKITHLNDISKYSWTENTMERNEENKYAKFASSTSEISGVQIDRYNFEGYGLNADGNDYSEVNYDLTFAKNEGSKIITITPIARNVYDCSLIDSEVTNGDEINEDNPLNPYGQSYAHPVWRFNFLKNISNKQLSILEFSTLGNVAVTTGDRVGVETNLYDANDNRITKEGFVFEIKIEYNGVVREHIKVNEFKGWLDG